jgi:hypothetical protein
MDKRRRLVLEEAYDKSLADFIKTMKEYTSLISGLLEIGALR